MPTTQMWFRLCTVRFRTGDYKAYTEYARLVNNRPVATLRDLLKLSDTCTPIDYRVGRACGRYRQAL